MLVPQPAGCEAVSVVKEVTVTVLGEGFGIGFGGGVLGWCWWWNKLWYKIVVVAARDLSSRQGLMIDCLIPRCMVERRTRRIPRGTWRLGTLRPLGNALHSGLTFLTYHSYAKLYFSTIIYKFSHQYKYYAPIRLSIAKILNLFPVTRGYKNNSASL